MPQHKHNYMVGTFVAGTLVLLVFALLWLAGSSFFRPVDRYKLYFSHSVSGLLPGAAVQVTGVTVGKVTALKLTQDSPPRVQVDFEVNPGVPIRRNSIATLSGSLVTGIRLIEIHGGTEQAGLLPQGDAMLVDENSMGDIQREATDLTIKTQNILNEVGNDVLSADNRLSIRQSLRNTADLSANLRNLSTQLGTQANVQAINATLINLNHATHNIELVSARIDSRIDQLSTKAGALMARAEQTVTSIQHLAEAAQAVVDRSSGTLQSTLYQLDHASRHLDQTIDNLEANPSILIWGQKVSPREGK